MRSQWTPDPSELPFTRSDRLKVSVWAATFEETVAIDGAGGRRYAYEVMESGIKFPGAVPNFNWLQGKRFESQIPWTETNEAFFSWVSLNMTELIKRLADIRKPERMIESISAGRLLPLGPSAQVQEVKQWLADVVERHI